MKNNKSEQSIQKAISDQMKKDGWYCFKIIKSNKNGLPDLCCVKKDDVQFIEVKKPGGVVSKLQKYRIKELNERGIKAEVRYD